MASIFQNSFFSVAGQKERLANVKRTVGAVVQNVGSTLTLGAIPKNTISAVNPSSNIGRVSAVVANNPVQTAGIIAAGINPKGAISAIKTAGRAVATAASSAFNSLSLTGKVATVVAAPVVAGTLIQSSKARESLVSAPRSLANVGTNLGKVIENPSLETVSNLFTENPVAVGALAVGAAVTAGAGTALLAGSNLANASATRSNTAALGNLTANPALGESYVGTTESAIVPSGTALEPKTTPTTPLVPTTTKSPRYTSSRSVSRRKSSKSRSFPSNQNNNKQQIYISVK